MSPPVTTSSRSEAVSDLFSIDVNAEIRKLCQGRYKTTGEPAMDLILLAAARAPDSISIEVHRRRLSLHCQGATLDQAPIELLAMIFHPALRADTRHRALVCLEEEHGLEIIAPFAGAPERVLFEWTCAKGPQGILFPAGHPPKRFTPVSPDGFKIHIFAPQQPRQVIRLIEERCRYAALPIHVNRRRVSRGFHLEGTFIAEKLGNRGMAGLPDEGALLRVKGLRAGIVVRDIVRPAQNGLALTAVLETNGRDIDGEMEFLTGTGQLLLGRVADAYPQLAPDTRARALELLFEQYKHTRRKEPLWGIRAFAQVKGPPLHLMAVEQAARQGPIYAIDAEQSPDAYETEDHRVLILTPQQRKFVDSETDIQLRVLPRKVTSGALGTSLRARFRDVARTMGRMLGRGAGTAIDDESLDDLERAFLNALRREIHTGLFVIPGETPPSEIHLQMADNQRIPLAKSPKEVKTSTYLISRSHPQVRAMVHAYSKNRAYVHPAIILLNDGYDGYAQNRLEAQRRSALTPTSLLSFQSIPSPFPGLTQSTNIFIAMRYNKI